MKHARTNSGFSALELLVAVSILAFAIGVPLVLLSSSQQLQTAATTRAELRLQARRAVDRIAEQLAASSAGWLAQNALPPPGITYQVASGWAAGGPIVQPAEQLALVVTPTDPDNGVDDDRDGLVDERRLEWTTDFGLPSARTHVLCNDVLENLAGEVAGNGVDENGNGLLDEPGFVVTIGVDDAVIRLSLGGRDSQGVRIDHTTVRTVAFRN